MSINDNDKHRIDQEVQKTLGSLDNLDDIEAGPYFHPRLDARIRGSRQAGESWWAGFLLGKRLVPSLLTVVVLLNVITTLVVLRDERDSQAGLRDEYVEALADEYLLTGVSMLLDIDSE